MHATRSTLFPLLVWCILTAEAGWLVPQRAAGQVTTANVEGTVRDDKENPAPDVEVVARNQETGFHRIVYSSEKGTYSISALTPGIYEIRASHISFNPVTKKDVQLLVGQTVIVDFSLTGKDIEAKEVVVEAPAPVVDPRKTDLSVSVRPEQILSLPLNSRNFLELATVAPGAKVSSGGRGPVTTGAVNSRFISAFVDGGEFKSDGLGGVLGTSFGVTTNIVPEDAIREFQVITGLYKAEFSQASNGVINAVTKTGGNKMSATAFGFFRSSALNAQGAFEKKKPDFNRQQAGLSLGGPIVTDQTHFFVSFERDNINNYTTVNTGGVQPALEGTFKNPVIQNLLLARVTHRLSDDNSLDARWIHVETDNNPGNFGGLAALNNGFNLGFRLNSLLAEDRWALGDNTVNELRVHFQRYVKEASPASTDPEHVYLSSGITTGWNPNQPQNEEYERLQIRDDLSRSVSGLGGDHIFKGGVNFEREPLASKAEFSSGGVFTFRTDTSALPFQGSIGLGDAQTRSLNYKYGVYVQDDWTMFQNLTLNLGLRWDVETNMINNDYVNPLAGDTALTNHVPAAYLGTGHRDIDYGQIAPRLGAALDLFGDRSTIVHGGFGVFYDRVIYNVASNEQQDGRYSIYTIRFGAAAPATTSRDVLASYVERNLGTAAPGVTLLPSTVPTPYTRQWTVGATRQIGPGLAASLDYVSVRGYNEYTFFNVNYQNGIGGPRIATPRYGAITLLTSGGRSWYDALQLSLSRPYRGDWQMQVSYTLSWADNTFDDPFQGYVFQSSIVRAPSLQDERHRFVVSGMVNLPVDFQLSGVVTLASPRPFGPTSVITGTDDNHDGVLGDDFPSTGRNSLRPDPGKIMYWLKDVDLRVTKYFEIMNGNRIGVIAEAFNLFNWTNYTSFFTRLNQKDSKGNLLIGSPNDAFPGRQIQLGVRIFI
jgi:hypothetical protein